MFPRAWPFRGQVWCQYVRVLVDELIEEALSAPIRGWDFTWLEGRATEARPPWDYAGLVREGATEARRVLDVDTGGGEVLSRIAPVPAFVVATESFQPNVAVARDRLAPLGIQVVQAGPAPDNVDQLGTTPAVTRSALPFRDGAFDLVIDRHSSYWPSEVRRVLAGGGRFISQQRSEAGGVGATWGELFGRDEDEDRAFDLRFARNQLQEAGFRVSRGEEVDTPMTFLDLAAAVYYLRIVPWAVDGFDPVGDRGALEEIHERLQRDDQLVVRGSHMLLDATRT